MRSSSLSLPRRRTWYAWLARGGKAQRADRPQLLPGSCTGLSARGLLDAAPTVCPLPPSSAAAHVAHGDRAGQRKQGPKHSAGGRPGAEELPYCKGARRAGRQAGCDAALREGRRMHRPLGCRLSGSAEPSVAGSARDWHSVASPHGLACTCARAAGADHRPSHAPAHRRRRDSRRPRRPGSASMLAPSSRSKWRCCRR